MATRKKKAKEVKSSGRPRDTGGPAGPLLYMTTSGIGVDYSAPTNVLLVSMGGISELRGAGIVALAYGIQRHSELGNLPSVSLVCRNVAEAKKAWDVFETWERETDGDAVSLSWFFSSKGHYRLMVGADQDRLRFRLAEADALGFRQWQLQQAAANLALSSELSRGRPHYAALQRPTAGEAIVKGLRTRHEMADGFDLAGCLANGQLIRQLVLDANSLLKSVGQPTTSSPEQVVSRLRKVGMLEIGQRKT